MFCCTSKKSKVPEITAPPTNSAGHFINTLKPHATLPLGFRYLDRNIQSGFHVTEFKSKKIVGLDCGATQESWDEVTIQLLDLEGDEGQRMTVGKFFGIATKALAGLPNLANGELVFEVGRGDEAMTLHSFTEVIVQDGRATVVLTPRAAVCKPLFRIVPTGQESGTNQACCG